MTTTSTTEGAGPLLHITTRAEWAAALSAGEHRPPSLAAEGFVHLSTPTQLLPTAELYYLGVPDLLVLHVDPARLSAPLRWDDVPLRGEPFPHLYGPLEVAAVVGVYSLRCANGRFEMSTSESSSD